MTSRTHDNTRRFRRQGLRVLVDYHVDSSLQCDYATSLSAGGLFIETESELEIGSNVKLRFRLPESEVLHEIEGRICWRNEPSEEGSEQAPGFGVAFTRGEGTETLSRELEDLEY